MAGEPKQVTFKLRIQRETSGGGCGGGLSPPLRRAIGSTEEYFGLETEATFEFQIRCTWGSISYTMAGSLLDSAIRGFSKLRVGTRLCRLFGLSQAGALCLTLLTVCIPSLEEGRAELLLGDTTLVFATVAEGRKVLGRRDDFVKQLSPFDRAVRLKTDREVSESELLLFVRQQVLAWTKPEKERIGAALDNVRSALETLALPLPESIYLVKTTGKEESEAAYTRAQAIVLPLTKLMAESLTIQKVLCHELFHILSRTNPKLRERLYQGIGFRKCPGVQFPISLRPIKITNPDAPRNEHCIRVRVDGEPTWAVPILFANRGKYDVGSGEELFDYLQFRFLLVERSSDPLDTGARYDGTSATLVGVDGISGFFEQVGRNTKYIIHPEEILADNFVLLILKQDSVASPEVLIRMRKGLSAGAAK